MKFPSNIDVARVIPILISDFVKNISLIDCRDFGKIILVPLFGRWRFGLCTSGITFNVDFSTVIGRYHAYYGPYLLIKEFVEIEKSAVFMDQSLGLSGHAEESWV